MSNFLWLPFALLIASATCAALNQTGNNLETINVNSHVPIFLSNIQLNATTTTNTTTTKTATNDVPTAANVATSSPPTSNNIHTNIAQKVPSRRTASENIAPAQTPASVFFANYNNQQNVMQLVRNIDARLRKIRNVEMHVATIQEIFDSMHFSSNGVNSGLKDSSNAQQQPHAALAHDLQIFSKRLAKKLQKATHVVFQLRDFLRANITKLTSLRNLRAGYEEELDLDDSFDDDDDVDEFDIEIDSLDSQATETNKLYLNTLIETCQRAESPQAQQQQNYNRQQIQILNYLKTERSAQQHKRHAVTSFQVLNERSLLANAYITEKLEQLKTALMKADSVYELPNSASAAVVPNTAPITNAKLKYYGNHFKHIYFLSRSDYASDPNEYFYADMHFRHLFVAAIKRKCVLLLIDVGSAMNAELLELTKAYVGNILQLLSDSDFISIVTVADSAKNMQLDLYPNDSAHGIFPATRERKDEILNFINNLSISKALTNHSLGFEYAFQMLHTLQNASLITRQNPLTFVYVTRGLLTNFSDAMHVLNVVVHGQRSLLEPIVINTCAVVLDEKRIMYEKQFLNDISTQNYTKYDIKVSDWLTPPNALIGKFFVLTKMQPDVLVQASTAVFVHDFVERYLMDSFEVHAPVVDASSKDVLVSITHAVAPFGVVGVNLYLSDLIEDIINYRQHEQHANKIDYAFLIDRTGLTIVHPAFPRPQTQTQTPFPVDIGFLENATDFAVIRRRMMHEEFGNASTTVYQLNNRRSELLERKYHWQSILGIYVLCLVSTTRKAAPVNAQHNAEFGNKSTLQMITALPMGLQRFSIKDNMPQFQHTEYDYLPTVELLYHRIDLMPASQSKVCRYFRQIATMDAATLFLSASAFESPFTFLHNNRMSTQQTQIRMVESIMAYIKDATGLLANPGLRPQIRNEVNALYNAMQHLKKRHQDAHGALKNYIIRRYIATVNGVLQVYPGCLLSSNYDPARRPWFRKAMLQPGKIVTTEPYLDAGGAGYIVTIAHTLFEGKSNALHSVERDQPVAIVALDLPYAYYYKMILDTTPLCQLTNIKCLLFENEGYLIAHPSMLETSTALKNARRPHEHLTHKESYVANDILNHKALVRKLACANYQNRTLQRYYVFNTSLTDILTNVVHGERTKYAISLVRGSNIFAAVLNSTCDGGAFCPCSTIDRICLNCNRMDQSDCECPCECPMKMNVFDEMAVEPLNVYSNYTQQYAFCEPPSEHFIALPETQTPSDLLHACVHINCDVYGTQTECLAVMGCEWCQQDLDGNGFSSAFCTAQSSCFNGVLSSLTPYGDLDDVDIIAAHGFNPSQKQNSYSAFGPVGGAIVVLCIVIGFAIYCYRHNLDTHAQDQFYIDSMQEENYGLPLSRFNFDDCQAHDEPPGSGNAYDHPAAQRNLIHPADISPYHMSTGSSYRRPPNGESDHGYSTMTPHEDSSEHQCFTLAEPLLLHDKRNSKSDTISISTSISSPTNRQHHQQPHFHSPYTSTTCTSSAKDARYNLTSPKKFHCTVTPSPARVYEQTTLPLHSDTNATETVCAPSHYILAPVTVHRHMETSES